MKVAAGIIGAVLGFFWGLLLAFFSGLHEPLHIFLPAFSAAAVASLGFVTLSNRFSRLTGIPKAIAMALIIVSAIGALFLFLGVVAH